MSLYEKLSKEDGKDKSVQISISNVNGVIYAINIRLDIINPVSIISMFISKPNEIEPQKRYSITTKNSGYSNDQRTVHCQIVTKDALLSPTGIPSLKTVVSNRGIKEEKRLRRL